MLTNLDINVFKAIYTFFMLLYQIAVQDFFFATTDSVFLIIGVAMGLQTVQMVKMKKIVTLV